MRIYSIQEKLSVFLSRKKIQKKENTKVGYQIYKVGQRFAGYGVPAFCEHPECNKEIDRGVSYACGDEPFSEYGCDRYFCSEHLSTILINNRTGKECAHKKNCDCSCINLCEMCEVGQAPFPYKKEHPKWVKHILSDSSWKEWRKNNKEKVVELKQIKKEYEKNKQKRK